MRERPLELPCADSLTQGPATSDSGMQCLLAMFPDVCEPCTTVRASTACSALPGASVRTADSHGRTVLHAATQTGSVDVMHLVLQEGCPVNARDRSTGQTALHLAASTNLVECTQLLCGQLTAGPRFTVEQVRAQRQGCSIWSNRLAMMNQCEAVGNYLPQHRCRRECTGGALLVADR
eukprot:TRINITY_DN22343_c0_g1_i1.p1 TRINITY_DN22343_c0_g1~~TRINITY_DN22343_c0_g1_i1.p1  ORF type:complete len:178 (+),score=18.93 TRINITY_DN22343_c0_g1_i1:291-824(+)